MTPQEQAIHETRQSVYGPWYENMAGTSQQLSGLITQMLSNGAATYTDGKFTLPDWAAALFMATAYKGNRIASGNFHADNFIDCAVYADMVKQMQKMESEEK